MKDFTGHLEISKITHGYWTEGDILFLKAQGFVYQNLTGREGVASIIELLRKCKKRKLLLDYEHGFSGEILELDDRPNLYKELGTPLDIKVAFYAKSTGLDITYFNRVLKESDYNMEWFNDHGKALKWLESA